MDNANQDNQRQGQEDQENHIVLLRIGRRAYTVEELQEDFNARRTWLKRYVREHWGIIRSETAVEIRDRILAEVGLEIRPQEI